MELHVDARGQQSPKACVDIGGTKVAVSVVLGGAGTAPRARRSEATVRTGDDGALARQVLRLIDESCAEAGLRTEQLTAVGVSACGPFVLNAGQVELAAPNICGGIAGPARGLPNDWTTAPIERPLSERFATVRVENDAIAALEAERRWGALQGLANCAYITWSTGIGGGLCVDGRALRGKNGNAGHFGHTFVINDPGNALCGCGNSGDLEGLVAGNAIARRFGSAGGAGAGWPDAAALLGAAQAGDRAAAEVAAELCRVLGRALYNLVVTLDLQRISLGGSVFWHHRGYLLPLLQAQLTGHLPPLTDGVDLVPAGLGEQLGDYAALALVS